MLPLRFDVRYLASKRRLSDRLVEFQAADRVHPHPPGDSSHPEPAASSWLSKHAVDTSCKVYAWQRACFLDTRLQS
jgi:hypothetical protein